MGDLKRVYESSLKGARCGRCGRIINENDRGWTKSSLANVQKFYDLHGVEPERLVAYVCGRCNGQISEEGSAGETVKELFTSKTPNFERTIRAELENMDLLPLLMRIQYKILGEPCLKGDTCVRDILTPGGYACKIETGSLNYSKCDHCLRKWLRSESPKFNNGTIK